MNTPDYKFVHNRFKLNGFHLNREDLCREASLFIKEGEPYQKTVGSFLLDWFDANDYIKIQTSGTTGKPKTIKVKKQAMVNSALATGTFFELIAGSKALHCLPAQYIAGKMMFVRAFILGWSLDFVVPGASPLQKNETDYDFSAMVPMQARACLSELHKIKKLIIGGAKINPNLEDELKKIPTDIYETYGMTETVSHIAAKKVGEKAFTVFPDVIIKQDDRGCLVIEAYKLNPEPVVTNDVIEIINDEKFIWLGRYDNVINSGGIKLFPEQIEEKLSALIPERFFVKGVQDELLGEKLVLFIESKPYEIPEDRLFSNLTKYEKPKEIRFIKRFLETGSGKIMRDKTAQSS